VSARLDFDYARPTLTSRQIEVLRGAATGETRAETAARLWLSVEGVKSHHDKIRLRLRARNVTHAVHLAHQAGLL
jgi:DNA-binding CsgD family transcriptional regulator